LLSAQAEGSEENENGIKFCAMAAVGKLCFHQSGLAGRDELLHTYLK
jgi:hypothetical protein